MPLIKRYPNRKLYDTDAKHYVSLDDVAAMIRAGSPLRVVDFASGEDLTAVVLVQVIVDLQKRHDGFLPQAVLAGLVQAGGDTLAALRRALAQPLDLARQVDEEIERRLTALVARGDLAAAEGQRLHALLTADRNLGEAPPADAGAVERAVTGLRLPTRADVRSLTDQLDVLEAELARLSSGRG